MKKMFYSRGTGIVLAATFAALMMASCPVPALAAERAVLGEEVTATW